VEVHALRVEQPAEQGLDLAAARVDRGDLADVGLGDDEPPVAVLAELAGAVEPGRHGRDRVVVLVGGSRRGRREDHQRRGAGDGDRGPREALHRALPDTCCGQRWRGSS
jgi:hypothetical protein